MATGLGLAVVLGCAGQASAWTRSVVTSASAELEVRSGDELRVTLRVGLQVQGGWLSSFEIAGLEPDLELDPSAAAWFVSRSDGRAYTPEVKAAAPGRVVVGFPSRREAPWRGDYELGLVYTSRSPLAHAARSGADRRVVAWQMPAWERGLEDVRITVTGPGSIRLQPDPELTHAVRVPRQGASGLLEVRRVQLPRGTPWTLRFELSGANTATSATAAAAPPRATDAWGPRPRTLSVVLGTWLCLLALAKHRALRRAARRRHGEVVPLVPAPEALRQAGIVALCVLGALFCDRSLDAALWSWGAAVLLALPRGVRPLAAPVRHAWDAAAAPVAPGVGRLLRLQELFVGRAWLDLTTPPGALLASSLLGLSLACYAPPHGQASLTFATLLSLPLFVTGTRLHLPGGAGARLRVLSQLACTLDLPAALRAELVADRQLADVRLRIGPALHADIVELAITCHHGAWLGRTRTVPALRVRVAPESPLAEPLALALPGAHRTRTARGTEWVQPTGTPAADLTHLLVWLDAPRARRSVAA